MRPRWWVLGAMVVAIVSFGGSYYVLTSFWPDPNTVFAQPQLLLLTFMFFGIGASTVPVTAYLNQRFAQTGWLQRDKSRLLRQGMWIGLLWVLLLYLQLTRTFSWAIAAVLVAVFILVEIFLLTRE